MLPSWRHVHKTCSLGCRVKAVRAIYSMVKCNAVQKPEELVQIVDEYNSEAGKATRAEMRAGNLIHRCSYAILENSKVSYGCQDCAHVLQ